MGCTASKLNIEDESRMSLGLKPIRIMKHRRRRSGRYSFVSTTELLQSEESDVTGDNSCSGKVKASAVAPEPIAEEELGNNGEEGLMEREELEEKKEGKEKKKGDLKEKLEEPKEKLEERRNQRIMEELKENKEQKEERRERVTMELKENEEERPEEEREEKSSRRIEELEEDREELKEENGESIQSRTEEMKESGEEAKEKKEEMMEKFEEEEEEDGRNLRSKKFGEGEEEFHGSPSFRFYCNNAQSFDSDDSAILSGFHRSTEKLEEIKQRYEPIDEACDSQASSKGSHYKTPKKGKGRMLLKLTMAPNAVRSLFTCYGGANCNNSCSGSNREKNPRSIGKYN